MKPSDVQKILGRIHDTVGDALDHMAHRFSDAAETLGGDYAHLADFSASWGKLSKGSRAIFVEQFLKSAGLVIAGTLAARAGIKVAQRSQRDLRNMILNVADLIEPVAKKTAKGGKKKLKKAKKRVKKAIAK